jgi:NitT/TauT family transport system permease protein
MQKLSAIDSPKNRIFSLVLLVVILGGWEGLIKLLGIPPFILPPPSMVAFALWQGFASGLYFEHIAVTVFQTIAGFILGCGLGFLLGVAVALSRQTAYFMYPYIVMFENMPKVALAPLIVLWFGLGMTSKIITAGLIAFFPLLVNTNTGLNSVDKDRVDLIRSLGGSERQIFFMVRLPSALPFIFAGLEVAIVLALIGTVVAEFLGAERGLGERDRHGEREVAALDEDAPPVGPVEAGDAVEEGRLAGPVRADQRMHRAAPHRQIDTVDRHEAPEFLRKINCLQNHFAVGHARSGAPSFLIGLYPTLPRSQRQRASATWCGSRRIHSDLAVHESVRRHQEARNRPTRAETGTRLRPVPPLLLLGGGARLCSIIANRPAPTGGMPRAGVVEHETGGRLTCLTVVMAGASGGQA